VSKRSREAKASVYKRSDDDAGRRGRGEQHWRHRLIETSMYGRDINNLSMSVSGEGER